MKTPDLHPDELLDKDARGELWGSELALLETHLAQCGVCRFERQARLDFSAELSAGGPDVEDLVAKVLAGQHVNPGLEVESAVGSDIPSKVSGLHARRRRRITPLLVLAAAMSLAGVAVAGGWTGGWPRLLGGSPTVQEVTPASSVATPIHRHGTGAGTTLADAPIASDSPTANESADLPVAELPVATLPLPTPPSEAPRAVRAVFASPVISAPAAIVVSDPAAAPPQVATTDEVGDLFARANRERSRGQHGDAVRSYRELLARFPNAPETRLSRATLGRLLLDDGDATGALDQLDHYLQEGDPTLREEAMVNRALALGRLGRADAETKAWSALLDSYPQSIHGARARARIGEISSR